MKERAEILVNRFSLKYSLDERKEMALKAVDILEEKLMEEKYKDIARNSLIDLVDIRAEIVKICE